MKNPKSTLILLVLSLCWSGQASAESIFRIEMGRDYRGYSQEELQRRVWELERAVAQLQQRVFQLEVSKPAAPAADSWLCSIEAMGTTYTGTGATKAVASSSAMDKCKAGRNGDGFFCKEAKCSQ